MRRKTLLQEESEVDNIDISPLIDIIFILLIFFIVTTVFIEETGVKINRPEAVSANNLEKESVLIAITDSMDIIYAKKNIGISGVRNVVAKLLRKDSNTPVIIQSDRNVPTHLLIKVIDEAKMSGANKVSVSTKGD